MIRITDHGKMKTWISFALNFLEKQNPAGSPSTATMTVPRLISVVEIIKREYIESLALKRSARFDLGLGDPPEEPESSRPAMIARALDGKNHPKQKRTPFMKVTLSLCALPELVERGATYQPPATRKISKSAKARRRKRAGKAKAKEKLGVDGVDSQMTSVP
ncbi:hypothetical protein BD779DRAFT_1614574 [Infundibulicybe gibba]|nr:hypothetical protein BD779DRAFT_1614574 [Infundibulicybe gibba]